MKATQLIELLEELVKRYGDKEVYYPTEDWYNSVDSVDIDESHFVIDDKYFMLNR